jgi:tetratricopeptide (TPR) repeat protein
MKTQKNNFAIFCLFLAVQAFLINPVRANLQNRVDRELFKKAENYYFNGDFDNAIKMANQFISQDNLSIEDRKDAYILLVHIFLAKSDATSARKVVEHILVIDPTYAPTLEEETPKYVTFVSEIKKQYMARQVKTDKQEVNWLLWGGAGVGATLLIILLASGDGRNPHPVLPLPPKLPED